MRKILLAELFCMLAITVQAQFVTIMGETETVVNDTVSTDFNPTDQYDFDEEDDDEDEYDDYNDEEDDFEDDELSYIEMECPNCGDLVDIDEELLFDDSVDVICPNCQAIILSSEEDEEGCSGCGCGCEDHDEK